MRKGKEFYAQNYEKAIELHDAGMSPKQIASRLGMSYSCVYHWVKGLRKPKSGNVSDFAAFLRENGPTAAAELMEDFPKHNELFLTAARRGLPVRRRALKRSYAEYGMWYYLDGQEALLETRIESLFATIRNVKEKLSKAME